MMVERIRWKGEMKLIKDFHDLKSIKFPGLLKLLQNFKTVKKIVSPLRIKNWVVVGYPKKGGSNTAP